jgi:predicted negative regulator of RcsB-dependent stress response
LESRHARSFEPEGAAILDQVGALFERYQRVILGVLIGAVLVGVGGFFYLRTRSAQEEQASGKLAEASVYFWQGDYARSLELAKQVYSQYGSVPSGIDAHRLAGDNAYWNGDFPTAVAEYRRYLAKVKSGVLADAARRSLAYALESDRKPLEAAKVYDELVGRFDRTSSAEFLIGAARSYRDGGQPDQAIQRLKRVDQEFGDTPYAPTARVQLGELQAATAR